MGLYLLCRCYPVQEFQNVVTAAMRARVMLRRLPSGAVHSRAARAPRVIGAFGRRDPVEPRGVVRVHIPGEDEHRTDSHYRRAQPILHRPAKLRINACVQEAGALVEVGCTRKPARLGTRHKAACRSNGQYNGKGSGYPLVPPLP